MYSYRILAIKVVSVIAILYVDIRPYHLFHELMHVAGPLFTKNPVTWSNLCYLMC